VLAGDPFVIGALISVLVGNVIEEWRHSYERMTDARIRLDFDWALHMHLARVGATMLVAFFLRHRPLVVGSRWC
jgi:ABC-type branched-subunit amino acid transport system permease subunit